MHSTFPPSLATSLSSAARQREVVRYIEDPSFPCVGAKSALNKDRLSFATYRSMTAAATDATAVADLCARLQEFSKAYPDPGASPVSLIAMFNGSFAEDTEFERVLWKLLQAMHDHDRLEFAWDPTVGSDPSENDFSLSIAGRAYFVVGLHPGASRLSRRAPFPCVAFNFHNQFESLKASGKFESLQAAIRSRDVALQGFINPVLARFGEASEARQYAGRNVESDWRCPFQAQPEFAT
jgi:uncharacterized protein